MIDGMVIRDAQPRDLDAIRMLLKNAGLPLAGTEATRFVVAERAGTIVGTAGLEVHGESALLRSVAVDPSWRGNGAGEALVRRALDTAVACHLDPVVLLTTTAPDWFHRFGFECIQRARVPGVLLESAEFTGACPDTATIMRCSPDAPLRGATR